METNFSDFSKCQSLVYIKKFEGREGPVRLPLVTVATKAMPQCPGVITPPTKYPRCVFEA